MQRRELRRRERRQVRRARFIAGFTAIAIGLGLGVGGTAVAIANPNKTLSTPIVDAGGVTTYNQNGLVCSSSLIGFQKPAAIDGSNLNSNGLYQAVNPNNWGSIQWDVSAKRVSWTINPGWDVDICVKGGTYLTVIDTSALAPTTSYVHTYAGLSHLGFRINSVPVQTPTQEVTCESVTYSKKSPLVNGEHFNITVDPPGRQINAFVDRNIEGGFNGLGLRVTAFGVAQPLIPLTEQQVTSGVLTFRYADYITTNAWTVTFVQTHDIDTWPNLLCGELTTETFVTPTASMVDIRCDAAGSYTLDRITGVRWIVGGQVVTAGTYTVTTASTIIAQAEAIAPDYALEPGAETRFTFVFNSPGACLLDADLRLTYMEECTPDPTYTFRVRNKETVPVDYTWTVAGNAALNGSGTAEPGDSFFHLPIERTNPAQSYTVTLHWGDGQSVLVEQTTKASGRDKVCELNVQPVVDITCAAPGTYTLPEVTGVRWSVDGVTVSHGTYSVRDGGDIEVRATATSGYVLYLNGVLSSSRTFTVSFTDPGPCIDPEFNGASITQSECLDDTPWINYSVVVDDPDGQMSSRTARLIFVHPSDPSQNHEIVLGDVTAGEALQGRVLWPGASVDPITGEPTGWPGWAQDAQGNWYETADDENFRWTRFLTEITLAVNPQMQIAITYPPPSEECVAGPIEVAPVAQMSTCETGGSALLLPPVDGVLWFINGTPTPGSNTPIPVYFTGAYTVTAQIDPDAEGGPYAFADGAVTEWPFFFSDDDVCDFPELPITNASIGFLAPTCDLGQRLDPTRLLVEDAELARLDSYREFDDGTYEVVFVTTDPDARFFDSSTPTPGRTVSNGGTTLTFTGTLLGPDRTARCVTTVELTDPVDHIDTCLAASFTVYRVDGIVYTVFINEEQPFEVLWGQNEWTRTIKVQQDDWVRVMPSPESDRFTISPDPAPFEHRFATYPDDCLPTLPLTEASVIFTPADCLEATNWVTLPDADGVQWWVDGAAAEAGTWAIASSAVVVEATPLDGFGFAAETRTRWEAEFSATDEGCALAYTGGSSTAWLLGVGSLAMMALGLGLVGLRRQFD